MVPRRRPLVSRPLVNRPMPGSITTCPHNSLGGGAGSCARAGAGVDGGDHPVGGHLAGDPPPPVGAVPSPRRVQRPNGHMAGHRSSATGSETLDAECEAWACPKPPASILRAMGVERRHRTLVITRKGGRIVTIPLAPRTARRVDLAIGERCERPIFLAAEGRRLGRQSAGLLVRRVARGAGITKPAGHRTLRHAFVIAALDAWVRCATCRKPPRMPTRGPPCAMTTLGNCIRWAGRIPLRGS
jgi:hypothetical protein